jgi:hypothetical protein
MNAVWLRLALDFASDVQRQVSRALRAPDWASLNKRDESERWVGIYFWRKDWRDTYVGFESWDRRPAGLGIWNPRDKPCPKRGDLGDLLRRRFGGNSSACWVWADEVPAQLAVFGSVEAAVALYRRRAVLKYYSDRIIAASKLADRLIPKRRTGKN